MILFLERLVNSCHTNPDNSDYEFSNLSL